MSVAVAQSFRRIDAAELQRLLRGSEPPLLLDVRRTQAFRERPEKIPDAVPLVLDVDPIRVPEVARSRPIVAYCLCTGATSSARVARWLVSEGYVDVSVLKGGLPAWTEAGLPLAPLDLERDPRAIPWGDLALQTPARAPGAAPDPDAVFLPRVAGQSFLDGRELPTQRDMVALFVDMVDSTELVAHRSPREVLAILQAFMEIVIDVAVYHCGDVHDFEGDGAFLYFEGPGEAVPAAFQLRSELIARRAQQPDLPLPRISLDFGPVVIGILGTRFRQTVALVGASVHRAAHMLKVAPPGGIIATDAVVEHARSSSPELARAFERAPRDFVLDEKHPDPVPVWISR